MRILAVLTLWLLPGLAAAQNWRLGTFDDGSYFMAAIYRSPGFTLSCGERSPQGRSAMETGNMEPTITRPGLFRMALSDDVLGVHDGSITPRMDVMIVVGTAGYTLPGVRYDELISEWWVDLPARDPVFSALAATHGFEIRSSAGITRVDGRGFADGLSALSAHCQRMFAAIGMPWPPAAPPGTPAPQAGGSAATGGAAMRAAAEADILRGCGGPAVRAPDYLLTGEIDGDGQEDVVLDWRSVECQSGIPRPFCGAAMCSADVYLSSRHPATGMAENLLALGVSLVALSNGNQGVRVGRSLADCGGADCDSIFYWNGVDFVRLQ